ncbi:hypothetical protein B0H65DRAFT_577934, partial [Neurospora tetraspora]
MDQTSSKKSDTMDKTRGTLKKSILAIDLGSTALRAAFVECEAPYNYIPIQNRNAQANQDAGAPVSGMGDFPVTCCPLDPNDPFARIGADAASEPGHVSAKYLMYILANVDDSVLADYPLPADLMTLKEDAQLREDCRTILAVLFGRLRERVDEYTKRRDLYFDEIILTIPSQWDATFEAIYESIVKEAFAYESKDGEKIEKNVHFCGEADALARYIILHEEKELDDWEVVLFLDFGGHSMSFATMELKRTKNTGGSDNSNMTFLDLDSGGCAGGSEMWSHQVGQLISEKLRETGVADANERKKFKLLSYFNSKKIGLMDQIREGGVLPLVCWDEHATLTTINLSHEEIKRCFDTALERPVAMAKEQLRKLKGYSGDKKIGVVVAGGTLKSNTAREAVFADCDIPENRIKYTTEIDVTWLSSCNCHGAALAHAKKMTVAQFFEQGAVIALQQKGPERNAEWEGFAYLLVGNDKKYVASVYNRKTGAEFKLVCNPNYAQKVTADKNEQDNAGEAGTSAGSVTNAPDNSDSDPNTNFIIPIEECYDLWPLGPQLAGRVIIEASLTSPSGTASSERTLHISISRKSQRAGPGDKVIDLPLFLDPGHNAVHVDVDALGPEASNQQAALRQREEEEAKPEHATTEAPSEQGSGVRPSSSNKSATAKASRTKRKRKDTNAAPAQPSKRLRTRADLGSDHEFQQIDYYAPPVQRKRKATAPASSTATKKARIATPAPQPNTHQIPGNQSDEDLQGQLQEQLSRESNAAQDDEQIEEQPQECSHTQEVPQHNDEDTHVHIDDQLDNELDKNHEPAATASGNHTQPPPPPLSPERSSSNNLNVNGNNNNNLNGNNNNNLNGNTSSSTRTRTAANARGATATRTRSHTPAHADRPATTYTNGRFAPRSSPPKRHRTEPLPEQRGQPQPRRSTRQQKGKSPVVASPAATRQQQQQQQQQQPQKGQEDPQPGPQHAPRPEQEARPQAGPSQAQAQAQNEADDTTPPATAADPNTLQQVATTVLAYVATHPHLPPRPTRIRQPAPEGNREDEGVILDSITVNPDPDDPQADQVNVDEDDQVDDDDKEDDDEDENDGDGGDDGDGDDDGDDDGNGPGLPDLANGEGAQGKSSSSVQNLRGESSGSGSGSRSGSANGRGHEDEAEEGSVGEEVTLRGPVPFSRLPRFQARASASPQAQGQARGERGNRVNAAERNKENQRQQTTGAGTGEESRPRPSREEKGKGKEVVKPAPKPAPTSTPTLALRAFYGQTSSAAASSSSSASAIPNTAPPSKPKGKAKAKAKGAEILAPLSRTALAALIESTGPTGPTGSTAPTAPPPIPPRPKPTDKGKGKDDVVVQTTPIPLPRYASASRAGRGVDGDGTEVEGGREQVVDVDGDEDSVEYGSRVLRSGIRGDNNSKGKGKEREEVNQTAGESSRTGGSNANTPLTRKRARIGIEDLLSSPLQRQPQPQEEDDSSPARKRQRTGGGGAGGKGGESSNAKKKRKRS